LLYLNDITSVIDRGKLICYIDGTSILFTGNDWTLKLAQTKLKHTCT